MPLPPKLQIQHNAQGCGAFLDSPGRERPASFLGVHAKVRAVIGSRGNKPGATFLRVAALTYPGRFAVRVQGGLSA